MRAIKAVIRGLVYVACAPTVLCIGLIVGMFCVIGWAFNQEAQ